jgi:alpha-N-arabinofuranosidase
MENYSLTERPGYLRLKGSAITMQDQDSPAFLGRRQTAMECKIAAKLDFNPKNEGEEAGLVIRGNEINRAEIGITLKDGKRHVYFLNMVKGELVEPIRHEEIGEGEVILSIEAKPLSYELFYQINDEAPKSIGNGKVSTVPADFDWFDFIVVKK